MKRGKESQTLLLLNDGSRIPVNAFLAGWWIGGNQ